MKFKGNENIEKKKEIVLSNNIFDIHESYKEIEDLDNEDFSNNIALTKKVAEGMIKNKIKRKRLWNMFVSINEDVDYNSPQDRKTQILDLGCSVCEEKEMLSSFFGGEKFPYCSKNVDITGIDVDSEAIELANKKIPRGFEDNFKFIEGNAADLSKHNEIPEKADVIMMRHQQMFKPNYNKNHIVEAELWDKMTQEGLKRLEKDGIFIITSYTQEEHDEYIEYLKDLNCEVVLEKENEFSEELSGGGIDKYVIVIKNKS